MDKGLHFISGLPRSGSTLLAALLRQNPRIHADISSPVASLVLGLQRQMSQNSESATFFTDARREAVLRGAVAGFYADTHKMHETIVDTNRSWCAKLPLLARLYPEAKIIACVRDVAWIIDSIERVTRASPLEPSGIFSFETGGTVFSRAGGLAGSDGLVGFALDALREAFHSPEANRRLMLLTYETLTRAPAKAMDAVYAFLGLSGFTHDFDNVVFDAEDFDRRLGTPGLHKVGKRVAYVERQTILPPMLFGRFAGDNFWRDASNPYDIAVV